MLKLFYVIFMNLHRAPYMIPRMRAEADHPQRYTEVFFSQRADTGLTIKIRYAISRQEVLRSL